VSDDENTNERQLIIKKRGGVAIEKNNRGDVEMKSEDGDDATPNTETPGRSNQEMATEEETNDGEGPTTIEEYLTKWANETEDEPGKNVDLVQLREEYDQVEKFLATGKFPIDEILRALICKNFKIIKDMVDSDYDNDKVKSLVQWLCLSYGRLFYICISIVHPRNKKLLKNISALCFMLDAGTLSDQEIINMVKSEANGDEEKELDNRELITQAKARKLALIERFERKLKLDTTRVVYSFLKAQAVANIAKTEEMTGKKDSRSRE